MNDRPTETISPEELGRRTMTGVEFGAGDSRRRLRCLITNDDGIESPGVHRLALVAARAGMDVVLAAPAANASGASASITALTDGARIVIESHRLPGLEDGSVYGVQASPAFIALTATRGAFGDPPDLVLSGINDGPNTGQAILHSGTVGAALTAAAQGITAMAVSLGIGGDEHQWDTAAGLAAALLPGLVRLPAGTAVNLNVPNVEAAAVRGLRRAPLAGFGAVQTHIGERGSGYFTVQVSDVDVSAEPDSDAALLAGGWATLTALHPVCAAGGVDLELLLGAGALAR
jgi:5'-nucleotidase